MKNNLFNRIFVIAKNTFRESIRDRILYNLVLFVLLITASAVLLGDLTDGHEARTITNIGLGAMLVFGVFISIFAKPVTRAEFILGKYLGLCSVLFINAAIMCAGVSLALLYVGGSDFFFPVWVASLLIFFELVVITGVAILFSSFSSPALSALLAFFVFIIGHLSSSLRELAAAMNSAAAKWVFEAVYYIFPNLAHFTFRTEAANQITASASYVGTAAVYALVYSAILLAITILIFSRRNFK